MLSRIDTRHLPAMRFNGRVCSQSGGGIGLMAFGGAVVAIPDKKAAFSLSLTASPPAKARQLIPAPIAASPARFAPASRRLLNLFT